MLKVMLNVFFDLDGTLIDSRMRLYSLFQHLVSQSRFTFDEYWRLKRNKVNHAAMLKNLFFFKDEMVNAFEQKWMNSIEHPKWLALDTPFDGVSEYLRSIKNKHYLHMITDRQYEERTIKQIDNFGWMSFFDKILVTRQKMEKSDVIRKNVKINPDDWIVGDTGHDIVSGKKLGIKTAGVLTGFLSKERIEEYEPDIILPSILDFRIESAANNE